MHLGAEVPRSLAPVQGPERYSLFSSLRVTPAGPQLWTRSHSDSGQSHQGVRPALKTVSAGGPPEVDT